MELPGFICGVTALMPRNWLSMFSAIIRFSPSSVASSQLIGSPGKPALFTRTSMPPHSASALSTAAWH
ncbi:MULTISPECIES: hypothetical protein [Paracoccus]|uniref:hypothetical protein n=1 Tax=Paracoccus sp. AS002 TaxID=3019545 RepID=UPI0023E8B44C|nr:MULTISPECIES: hypothetical protein [Paracoccus]MDF3904770.1 hypothetical protein [Paracoccus sp. AS002]